MTSSTPQLPADRQAIGQLVTRLQQHFRNALFNAPGREEQFPDIRLPHLQIWGNVGIDGVRLTDLAERANLSLATCSELVSELQENGYLERRPDPRDGRAKLIFPTTKGLNLLAEAGRVVAELESQWRALCPPGEFDRACRTFDHLLNALGPRP
jgi:DNA-binding MarR family transcriptional regulator